MPSYLAVEEAPSKNEGFCAPNKSKIKIKLRLREAGVIGTNNAAGFLVEGDNWAGADFA